MATITTAATQKPGLRAHENARQSTLPELVGTLHEIVVVRLVASIGNVKSTRPVAQWAAGERTPGETDVDPLRMTHQIAAFLREHNEAVAVQSWFKAVNLALDDA